MLDRDLLKAPSMTKAYSAGTYTFGEQIQGKTTAQDHECMWLAAQIDACFTDVTPGMLAAMGYKQEISDVLTAAGLPICWETPAGLSVEQARPATQVVQVNIISVVTGKRKASDFTIDLPSLSKKKQRAGVSPNFVHGVDASHMAMTVNALHARGVRNFWMIHDSFGVPLAECAAAYEETREQFIKLMSRNLLAEWTEPVTKRLPAESKNKLPPLSAYGSLDIGAVRQSMYAWL